MATLDTSAILALARKHVGNGAEMESSARLCLADAVALAARGEALKAQDRARKSLAYSVGIFHDDYIRVTQAWGANEARAEAARRLKYASHG